MSGRENLFNSKRGMLLPLFCVLMSVLASSCADEQPLSVTIVKDVAISDTLHGRLVIDPDKVLFSPSAFAVCGDALLTYTRDKELLFDLWDLNDNCRHISEFGYEGRAANEFNSIDNNSLVATDSSFSIFCAGDMSYKTAQMQGDTMFNVVTLSGFDYPFDIDRVMRINDTVFVSSSSNVKYEFARTNVKTNKVEFFGAITDDWFCSPLAEEERSSAMVSNRCVNPSTGAMAVFYANFKKVRLYDSLQNLVRDVDVQIEPYDRCYDGHQVTGFYLFPYATDQYMYVICSEDDNYKKATKSELQIWDWDGNLQSRYVLDKGIVRLVYYPKRNVVLGKTSNDELYEFQLP